MNTKLLRKIQRHILEEPKRYDQNEWLKRDVCEWDVDKPSLIPPCRTIGCIAGWACALEAPKTRCNFAGRARRLVGLTKKEANRLFSPLADTQKEENMDIEYGDIKLDETWPEKFRAAYRKAKTPLKRARVAAARIDHFIKTKGAE